MAAKLQILKFNSIQSKFLAFVVPIVLLTTVVFTVSMSSARAQDATASGTRSFSVGAFFIGIFNAESDGEVSAMAGVFGYVARRRVLLGVQGGFLGSYAPVGVYGLANVGYFLRVRNGYQRSRRANRRCPRLKRRSRIR